MPLSHVITTAATLLTLAAQGAKATTPPPYTAHPTACDSATQAAIVRSSPARPRAGTLVRLAVRWHARTAPPVAWLAGEPLHWSRSGDSITARAAVPIDSTTSVTLTIACDDPAATRIEQLPTTAGAYRLEALRVAPKFSAEPDSALAARMADEAARAAKVSRAAHETPRLWTQPFLVPRPSRVTSTFGSGRTFNGTVTSRHMGTDFAGAVGAPVRASNRGVVRLVGAFYLGGNVIYLDHGEGLVTAYLHLSRQRVAVGDTVARGQIIGNVGATGRVTAAHLHFITRYGQVTVDPTSVLSQRP